MWHLDQEAQIGVKVAKLDFSAKQSNHPVKHTFYLLDSLLERPLVTRGEIPQTGLRVNLRGRDAFVPQELLYLIKRHSRI